MPLTAPKSLSNDEVYGLVAYLLNQAEVVPADFTLTDKNIAEAQARMPNRNGMTLAHALWPGKDMPGLATQPDIQAKACMSNCGPAPTLRSALPEHASNNHGNLAQQNRLVGAQRGIATDGVTYERAVTFARSLGKTTTNARITYKGQPAVVRGGAKFMGGEISHVE